MPPRTVVVPASPERWSDVERLFGPRGAYGDCWCTFWRLPRAEYREMNAAEKRRDLRDAVRGGDVPGLLALRDDVPVGWVAVQPRGAFAALLRSPTLRPQKRGESADDPVGAVTCFFIHKEHRRSGLMTTLLKAAVRHAKASGAAAIEGYPYESEEISGAAGYMGLVPAYERAGFVEVARPSMGRRVMRRELR